MKAATVRELRRELENCSPKELIDICLRLSKFKKENKELLTYLLYEAADEQAYIESVKREMDRQFADVRTNSYYYLKKNVRKILRQVKKYIRYSKKKETEAELLIHFCRKLRALHPPIERNRVLWNLYERQLRMIRKAVEKLHEDLQYDYEVELEALGG